MADTKLKDLKAPFPAEDIEWRVGSSGKKTDGTMWAMVLPYITSRAVMERLDEVFGLEWQNGFTKGPEGGILCGISAKIGEEWLTRYDGAENTKEQSGMEGTSVKGGLSGAMKRAAVQWGIGRYLYDLESRFVTVHPQKTGQATNFMNSKKTEVRGFWETPILPSSALPQGDTTKAKAEPAEAPPDTREVPAVISQSAGEQRLQLVKDYRRLVDESGLDEDQIRTFAQMHINKDKPGTVADLKTLVDELAQLKEVVA